MSFIFERSGNFERCHFIGLSLLRDVQFLSGIDVESFGGGCCFVRLKSLMRCDFFYSY